MNFDFAGYFISFFLNSRNKVQNNQRRCSPCNLACSFISSVIRLLILTKAIDIRSFQVRRRRNVRDGKDIENNSHLEEKTQPDLFENFFGHSVHRRCLLI